MAETSIGIRIADGTFYPVLAEGTPARKRVILTTVKDNQTGAQIDLFRGNGTGISGASYIGSLVIDEIEPAPQGGPEIELIVSLDSEGNLDAEASDRVTGEHQSLSVALDTLQSGESYAIPEFDLDEEYNPDFRVSPAEESGLTSEPVPADFSEVEDHVRRMRRRRVLQYVGIAILVVAVILLVLTLIFWLNRRPSTSNHSTAAVSPATSASSAVPATAKPAETPATPAPATAGASTSTPPISTTAKSPYREGGVSYQIRWGDTLWDLSISFYRTPWLYGKIAKANNIKNPNLIFANTVIYIPER